MPSIKRSNNFDNLKHIDLVIGLYRLISFLVILNGLPYSLYCSIQLVKKFENHSVEIVRGKSVVA